MIADMFDYWLESIAQQGTYYIYNLIKVFGDVVTISREFELEAITWEKEKSKWAAVLMQMNDVQKFGVMEFLVEKPVDDLDDNVMYVSRKNMEWRNPIIKQGHEESIKLLKELKELINTMQKDLKCVDIQLLKVDGEIVEDAIDVTKAFKERMQLIKETKSLTIDDFSKVARIESMLTICFDHLEAHKMKVL